MKAWEQFLEMEEQELGAETVGKWLRSLRILRFDACNLYLEAQDSFQALWFEEQMRQKVKTRLFNPNNKLIKVHVAIANEVKNPKKPSSGAPAFRLTFDSLDPQCTFEAVVETQGNKLPLKVLLQAVEQPKPLFNPIYIYGGKGTGKSHLLMAAAHSFRKQGKKVAYVRAESFTDHVVAAIRAGQMSAFRAAYRESDVLIIDDLDHFARKSATQEELFHTFNTLHLAGKPILLGALHPPGDLQHIEPRLISRFEWGLALAIAAPSHSEQAAILNSKAALLSFKISPRTVEYLLETFPSSPKASLRALEALVLRTHIRDHSNPAALTLPAVKHLLEDLIAEEQESALTSERVLKATASHYAIPLEDLLGKSRSRECVLPRQVAMFLCRQLLKLPYMKIGDLFSRDHSTVISSVKLVQKAISDNATPIAGDYHQLLRSLGRAA